MSLKKHEALLQYAFRALDCMNEIAAFHEDKSLSMSQRDALVAEQVTLFLIASKQYDDTVSEWLKEGTEYDDGR